MKTKITVVCLGVLALWGQAQTQDSTASSGGASVNSSAAAVDRASLAVKYQVVERGADHRVMERKEFQKAPDGKVITQLHRYAQVATGLHYQNERGQWVESKAVIEALPDGSAAARQGQHQAFFPGNLYQGAVRLIMPDGRELTSRPIGLSYDDGEKMVMFAELKPASGQLKGANQVIYESAFTGVQADVIYTYRLDGFEQDIVLKKQPPTPESLGLKRETARLQVVTEFFNPPTPVVREAQLPSAVAQDVPDQTLDFGAMRMTAGRAFFQDKETLGQNVWVGKQWLEVEGRKILVEEVPLESVAADLSTLPLTAKLEKPMTPLLASGEWQLPPQRLATLVTNQPLMQVARADLATAGLVLDYNTIIASASDYTFKADCTYYLTGDYWLMGKTTIEGGTVIKFAPTGNVALNIVGTLDCQTGPYRPAIFTSKDDDTVGEIIADSTGNPVIATNEAAGIFYSQDYYYVSNSAPISIHDCHFRYHKNAIIIANFSADAARTNEVRDCQFKSVRTALTVNGASTYAQNRVRNVLIDGAVMAFFIWNHQTVSVENATLRRVTYARLSSPSPSLITYTNCLFVCVTNLSEWNDNSSTLFATSCGTNASEAGVFQAAGGGNSYLATNSPYRNLGTTNIHPGLLAALKQKTTFAPVIYSNVNFAMPQTLAPQVPRDDDVPDLGYHYVPLDYVFGGCVLFTNLTVAPGTAVGWYAGFGSVLASAQPYGILLSDGAKLEFAGTASQPCWVAPFMAVQEAANGAWPNRGWMGGIVLNGSDPTTAPRLNARFTKWSAVQGVPGHFRDNWAYGEANLSHCEFYSATIASYAPSLYFTNCFFHRVFVAFWSQQDSGSFTFKNCTFNEGCLAATRGYWNTPSSSNRWRIENTAFEGTCFSWWDDFAGDTNYTYLDFNAYNTNNLAWQDYPYPYPPQYGVFMTSGAHDVLVGGYQWQTSSQGNFYLPASSPLLNAGSQLASAAGLYHYTTQTNQVRETNSTVDIGYHTVALAPDGLSWSTYWNGMADYLADTNGDGGLGAWLTQYFGHLGVNPNDDSDADGVSNLQEYQAGSNPLSATMVFAWGDNSSYQLNVPAGLTNAVLADGGGDDAGHNFSVALKNDGTVVTWGDGSRGQTNVPAGLGSVADLKTGWYHTLVLRTNGAISAWGAWGAPGFPSVSFPSNLPPLKAIAAGGNHDLGLLSNGTVVAWGYDTNAPHVKVPTNLPPVKAIAAGWTKSTALLTNGTVVMWGTGLDTIPENLTNVVAIAAGSYHTLFLKADGTVAALGNTNSSMFFTYQGESTVPANLSNVVAIAASYLFSMALKSDGTVVTWGNAPALPLYPLNQIKAIGRGLHHALAVRSGLLTPLIQTQPTSQIVAVGSNASFTVQAISFAGTTYQWQFEGVNLPQATNATLLLTNLLGSASGNYRCLVSNPAGSVVSSNALLTVVLPPAIIAFTAPTNRMVVDGTTLTLGVTAVVPGNPPGYPISYQWRFNGADIAGATATNYSFSTLWTGDYSVRVANAVGSTNVVWHIVSTNAPVNVTNDLLLIYNTNSADSTFCVNYYLTHRPNVGGANVLGIGYTNPTSPNYFETVTPQNLTNQIFNPLLTWLTNNPTKRPQYVILFMDLPSRVNSYDAFPTNGYSYDINIPSVCLQMRSLIQDWRPYVTHLNMGMTNIVNRTNDCVAYINKLATIGVPIASNSPVLSASLGGYANTNFVLDNVRFDVGTEQWGGYGGVISPTINGLLSNGVPAAAIQYFDATITDKYFNTNVNQWVSTYLWNGSYVTLTNVFLAYHATNAANLAGYVSWGVHGNISPRQTVDGSITWRGNSGWWLINTIESYNGQQFTDIDHWQGSFSVWYSSTAFGGTNYSNTPVGAVTTVDEPFLVGKNDNKKFFGLWANGKNFGVCAWNSTNSVKFQATGDPLIAR